MAEKKEVKNQVLIDGTIKKDVTVTESSIIFTLCSVTGYTKLGRPKYTYIKCLYDGEITEDTLYTISTNNNVRIYGKLDSEEFISKSNKKVFNKILYVENISLLVEEGEQEVV